MPELKNGNWYIGDKKYKSKKSAEKAWAAYQAKKHGGKKRGVSKRKH